MRSQILMRSQFVFHVTKSSTERNSCCASVLDGTNDRLSMGLSACSVLFLASTHAFVSPSLRREDAPARCFGVRCFEAPQPGDMVGEDAASQRSREPQLSLETALPVKQHALARLSEKISSLGAAGAAALAVETIGFWVRRCPLYSSHTRAPPT